MYVTRCDISKSQINTKNQTFDPLVTPCHGDESHPHRKSYIYKYIQGDQDRSRLDHQVHPQKILHPVVYSCSALSKRPNR